MWRANKKNKSKTVHVQKRQIQNKIIIITEINVRSEIFITNYVGTWTILMGSLNPRIVYDIDSLKMCYSKNIKYKYSVRILV